MLPDYIRLIQGDGIDINSLKEILAAMAAFKWSADNLAFGSGGGLLQKMNRDTLNCAYRCSWVEVLSLNMIDMLLCEASATYISSQTEITTAGSCALNNAMCVTSTSWYCGAELGHTAPNLRMAGRCSTHHNNADWY